MRTFTLTYPFRAQLPKAHALFECMGAGVAGVNTVFARRLTG